MKLGATVRAQVGLDREIHNRVDTVIIRSSWYNHCNNKVLYISHRLDTETTLSSKEVIIMYWNKDTTD